MIYLAIKDLYSEGKFIFLKVLRSQQENSNRDQPIVHWIHKCAKFRLDRICGSWSNLAYTI